MPTTQTAFETAATETFRSMPNPASLELDQEVWILPSEYDNDSIQLTLGMVTGIGSDDNYEVDCDGIEIWVHAQRLRAR